MDEAKAARIRTLAEMLRRTNELMTVPQENYGLYKLYPPPPDTRSRFRKFADEVRYRIAGAWDCLMGRHE